MAAFKEQIDRDAIERLAGALHGAWRRFPRQRFAGEAVDGLDGLELKARVAHVAAALRASLPPSFEQATPIAREAADRGAPWQAFDLWPLQHWVMDAGIDDPDLALPLVAHLTPHFSGEFALRPFIDRHPDLVLTVLLAWASHPDEHVRRLASEGSRPLLPWGPRLTVPAGWARDVIDALHRDPSAYVRRSVANHLNDLGKADPELALALAEAWLASGDAATERLVRHGLRTLLKRGDPQALALAGVDHRAAVEVERFTVSPDVLPIGGSVAMSLTLRSDEPGPAAVAIEYTVHFVGAAGRTNRRTFRWRTLELAAGASVTLQRRHAFRDVSIRTHRPGVHRIAVQVNGAVRAEAPVRLEPREDAV